MAESSSSENAAPDAGTRDNGRDEEIDLLDLLIILAKHKKLLLGLPIIAALAAVVVALLLPNYYAGTTKILPPQQSQSTAAAMLNQLGALAGVAGGAFGVKNPNDLYVGILRSRTLADSLIHRFELQKVYETKTLFDARRRLHASTTIVSGKDGIITIDFEDKEPKRAAAVANAYIEELYKLTQTIAVTEASQRRLFFEKQLKAAKESLASAEVALRQMQEATGLIKLDDQGKAIIESVARLRAEIAAKEVQLVAMRTFATENNPDYIMAGQQLSGLRVQLAKLETANTAGQGDIFVPTGKVPAVGLEYVRKMRDVKYHEVLFELLAKQYEIARVDEAKDTSMIQVLDKAIEPERKSRPKRAIIVIVTALVFGFLAVVWAFISEARERARRDPQQAERLNLLRRYLLGR